MLHDWELEIGCCAIWCWKLGVVKSVMSTRVVRMGPVIFVMVNSTSMPAILFVMWCVVSILDIAYCCFTSLFTSAIFCIL